MFIFITLISTTTFAKTAEKFIMGSIGDSITTAMNSNGWGERKPYNWSTGTTKNKAIRSHFHKIKKITQKEVTPYNSATSGATSNDIAPQIDELLPKKPDYVTIMIGANDACSWAEDSEEQLDKYEDNVSSAIERLISNNSQIKILLVPIPNMYHLWETAHNEGNCQLRWNFLNICPNLLSSKRTEKERQEFQQRVYKANDRLEKIALANVQHVKFDRSIADFLFENKHISKRDCFHPSLSGQNIISSLTWKRGWFQDLFVMNY